MKNKNRIAYLVTILLSLLYIIVGNKVANKNYIMRDELIHGVPEKMKVISVIDNEYEKTIYGN